MTSVLRARPVRRGGLAALLRCPGCSSRELVDATPVGEDRGWWARLRCVLCGHEWVARS